MGLKTWWDESMVWWDEKRLESKLAVIGKQVQAHYDNGTPTGSLTYQLLWSQARTIIEKRGKPLGIDVPKAQAKWPVLKNLEDFTHTSWFAKNSLSRLMMYVVVVSSFMFFVLRYFNHL